MRQRQVKRLSDPYLALGAVIVAGLDGIRRGLELPEPVTVDPGNLSDSEREKRGISRLPSHLGVAIAHLQRDDLLLGALGDDLAKAFLAVRSCEWEEMKTWESGKEVQLLLERY